MCDDTWITLSSDLYCGSSYSSVKVVYSSVRVTLTDSYSELIIAKRIKDDNDITYPIKIIIFDVVVMIKPNSDLNEDCYFL